MFFGTLEPISNRADWIESFELVDDETDEVLTQLEGLEVLMEVRDRERCRAILTASTTNGKITFLDGGVIQWAFTASDLRNLCAGTYDLGVVIRRDGIAEQEIIATLPVVDGVVCS